ncbi:MAG: alpha/beta fold hydrolase, partial [Actinomycetota bacterium]
HRGHGRGIRGAARHALADLADDAVAVLDELGVEQAIAVGYSLGGPVAQLVWHRHPDRTAGLVLCATAHRFRGLEPLRDLGPSMVQRLRARAAGAGRRGRLDGELRRWLTREMALAHHASPMRLGLSMARFDASAWIGDVDVPHAVVVTTRDAAVVPPRQRRLAAALPAASVHEAPIDHTGCVYRPAEFVPVLLEALASVADG